MSKHTPKRLKVDDHPRREYPRVTDDRGRFVADCEHDHARRLAACWNACEGIPTDDLEQCPSGGLLHLADHADQLLAQRDELLAALRGFVENQHWNHQTLGPLKAAARAAIAKATGEAK